MSSMLRSACAAAWVLASVHAARAATPGADPLSSWSGAIPTSANGPAAASAAAVQVSTPPQAALPSWSGLIPVGDAGARGRTEGPKTGHGSAVLSSWSGVIVVIAAPLGVGGVGP